MIYMARLEDLTHTLEIEGVRYGWGAKSPLTLEFGKVPQRLDCSGFAQLAMYYASNGQIVWPAGTAWDQYHHAREQEYVLREHKIQDEHYMYRKACENTRALLVCFISPKPGAHAGHVWFIHQSWTLECCGGRGVTRRHWSTPVLDRECQRILVLDAVTPGIVP